jgi:hypothetical protein
MVLITIYIHICRKLSVADGLVQRLLAAAVAAAQGAQPSELPLQVAAHYLHGVVDWLVSLLLSKPQQNKQQQNRQKPGGAAAAKGVAAAEGSAAPGGAPHPREDPRCWALLGHTLEAATPLLHGASVTSPGLCSAAAAACAAAAGDARAAALAAALLRTLRVLGGRYALSYRPTAEQQAALLVAALQALRAAGPGGVALPVWTELAVLQLDAFRAAAQSHPAPRKMFSSVVTGDVFPLLVTVAFTPAAAAADADAPPGSSSNGDGSSWRHGAAAEAAQRALATIIFHPSHVAALTETCRELAAAAQAAAAPDAVTPAAADAATGKQPAKKARKAAGGAAAPADAAAGGAGGRADAGAAAVAASAQQGYQAALLKQMASLLSSGLANDGDAAAAARALLVGLPQLLRGYCAAVKRHRRLLESGGCRSAASVC